MKTKNIEITYVIANYEELSIADRQLVDEAREATSRSYAPYSKFSVGAAVRLVDGTIVIGANQENAVYPLGLCAERNAVFSSQSLYPGVALEAIAISARDITGEYVKSPVTPCGSCRQVLLEQEDRYKHDIRLILVGEEHIMMLNSVKDLLPFCFSSDTLG